MADPIQPKVPAGYREATDDEKKLFAKAQRCVYVCAQLESQVTQLQEALKETTLLRDHHAAKAPAAEDKGGILCVKV